MILPKILKYDAVLEGGGAKIPGLVGALDGIESWGMLPSHLAGTSAGAIVGSLRAAGYTPEELKELILSLDFTRFLDGNGWGTKTYHLFKNKGIYAGDEFLEYMREILLKKGVRTFGDLRSESPKDRATPVYRWKLRVYAADIVNERLVTWPHDGAIYGIRPDDIEVAWAIRCSVSIPGLFRPVILKYNGVTHYFVDGGILSNFPIWTFDSMGEPEWPTFGLLLQENDTDKPRKIGPFPHDFFMAMFNTMMKAHDRRFVRPEDYEHRTIRIPVGDAHTTDFDMAIAKKEDLFHKGQKAAARFFHDWSWPEYKKWACEIRGIRNG